MTRIKALKVKELPAKTTIAETKEATRRRIRYACKPMLQTVFDIVNLIPPDQEMECPYIQRTPKLFVKSGSPEWIGNEKLKYEAFQEYLKSFPKEFQAHIFYSTSEEMERLLRDFDGLDQETNEADELAFWNKVVGIQSKEIHYYEKIRAIRKDLYLLTQVGDNLEHYLGQQLDIALSVLLVEYAYLDEEGRLRRQPNPYAELMEGIEVSRIRACLICRKLFWANRKDKKCCSEEHSAIIRQRQSRLNKEQNAKLYAKSAKLRKQRKKSGLLVNKAKSRKQKGK